MAKALGIGGVFFKSPNPEALMAWYQKALNFPEGGYVAFEPGAVPKGGSTTFCAFKASTDYFAPSAKEFMINLMVDDLQGALKQVAEAGGTVVGEVEDYDYGIFGRFVDPDGNKIELWQPK